jgi:hypothetical protein
LQGRSPGRQTSPPGHWQGGWTFVPGGCYHPHPRPWLCPRHCHRCRRHHCRRCPRHHCHRCRHHCRHRGCRWQWRCHQAQQPSQPCCRSPAPRPRRPTRSRPRAPGPPGSRSPPAARWRLEWWGIGPRQAQGTRCSRSRCPSPAPRPPCQPGCGRAVEGSSTPVRRHRWRRSRSPRPSSRYGGRGQRPQRRQRPGLQGATIRTCPRARARRHHPDRGLRGPACAHGRSWTAWRRWC